MNQELNPSIFDYLKSSSPARSRFLDACKGIVAAAASGGQISTSDDSFAVFRSPTPGCFVSLYAGGNLRGCRGSTPDEGITLMSDLASNARNAAAGDKRFSAVAPEEVFRPGFWARINFLKSFEAVHLNSREDLLSILSGGAGVAIRSGRFGAAVLPERILACLDAREAADYLFEKAGMDFESFEDYSRLRAFVFPTVAVVLPDFESVGEP